MTHKLIVISGPSGAGKGTIVKELKRRGVAVESVSCTTRKPRVGEQDGREYFFLSREEFQSRIDRGEFLEYDEHFGNLYGTPLPFVEKQLEHNTIILEIDVVGGLAAKAHFPDRCVLVFIKAPSVEALSERLGTRATETGPEREERLARVQFEFEQQSKYDYVVVNDDLKTAVDRVEEIILAETK